MSRFVTRPLKPRLLLWSILLGAIGLRLAGIAFASSTPVGRPDEEIFAVEALGMFVRPYGRLFTGWPDVAFRLWHAVVWLERAWYRHRFGGGVNLACLVALDPLAVILPVRVFLATLDVATALIVGRLAAEVAPARGEAAALWAVALYAVNYLVGRNGHFAVSDPLVCFEVAVTLLCCSRAISRSPWWLVAAAFCAGTAFSTKYIAVGLAFPCAVAAVDALRRRAALPIACAAVAAVIGVLLWSPDIVTRWSEFRAGFGSHLERFGGEQLFPGFLFYGVTILPTAFGWPGLLLCLGGVVLCGRGRRGAPLVVYVCLVYACILGPLAFTLARYGAMLVPPLAAAGGIAADLLVERLSATPGRGRRRAALVAVALGALAIPAARLVAFDRLLGRADTRDLARDWLVARGADEVMVTEGVYAQVHAVGADVAAVCERELPAALWRPVPILAAPVGPISAPTVEYKVTVNIRWMPVRLANEPVVAGRGESEWERIGFQGAERFVIWEHDQQVGLPDLHSPRAPDFLARARGPRAIGWIAGAGDSILPLDRCWVPAAHFSPGDLNAAQWEPHDAFFVPWTGFRALERPGPEIWIYRNACKG
jgi:4-amino-4-deoxy-L-arabinose transferase-like glycosyltransferase